MLMKLDKQQQRVLYIVTFVMIGLALYLLRSYVMLIIFSAIMASLFTPVYDNFIKKGKSPGKASFYTFTISMLSIVIPLIFVIFITILQINTLVDNISAGNYSFNLTDMGNQFVETLNNILTKVGVSYQVTLEELTTSVSAMISKFGASLLEGILNSFSGFFGFITAAIIYIYVFLSMLTNKSKIIDIFKKLNPLGDDVSDLYLDRANQMTKATVRGQFIIAFMQGLTSAAVIALVGPNGTFFFLLILLTVMSVIPLGAGIITIPIGIVMILSGNITGGIIVIANHLIIVTNIDNIMRPRLVPKNARLDPALMILAVFAGLSIYGFLGIVIGPIIMILVVTTIQIYLEVFYKEKSIDYSKTENISTLQSLKSKLSKK